MPHDIRKVRKMRGSRTHGWGQVSQHRRMGSGGHGNAGLISHKKSWMLKYDPEHFGRHGFKRPYAEQQIEVVNVGMLNETAQSLVERGKAEKREEGIFIDLEALGFNKLLGSGKVTQPLLVKVKSFSERAAEKVSGAGGKIVADEEA